jgi:hypothetical protein
MAENEADFFFGYALYYMAPLLCCFDCIVLWLLNFCYAGYEMGIYAL